MGELKEWRRIDPAGSVGDVGVGLLAHFGVFGEGVICLFGVEFN